MLWPCRLIDILHKGNHTLDLFLTQVMHLIDGRLDENRQCIAFIEEIPRRNFKKVTDVKERFHGRERFTIFYFINVAVAETEREAHFTGRNPFLYAKVSKSFAENTFIIIIIHEFLPFRK